MEANHAGRIRRPGPRRRVLAAATTAAALCLGLAACGGASSSGTAATTSGKTAGLTPITVQLALVPPKMAFMGFYVAKAEGFFKKNGLNVTLEAQPTGNQAVRGLASGAGVFAAGGTDALAAADAQGGHLVGIWNYGQNDFSIIGAANVPTLKALKGKTIGVTDMSGPAYTMPVLAMASVGLPASAAHYVVLSGRPALVTALVTGRIQAAAFHTDDGYTLISKDPQAHVLAHMSQITPKWWYGVVSVERSYAQSHSKVVDAFLTAMVEAQRWMYTHSAQTIALSVKDTQETQPVIAKSYKTMTQEHIWVTNAGAGPADVTYTLGQFKKDGVIPKSSALSASQIMDSQFINTVMKKLGPGSS